MQTIDIIKKNNKWKYDKIYHLSDIHIRNTLEHVTIYNHVFDNLYKFLQSIKSDKSIIVITGDILHNKDKLTTVCETLCIDFLENLSSIMTTVIIPGNHDFNEKGNTREDSLATILYKRPFNNLYYLKLSNVYRFNNILFGVSSLIDNLFVKAEDILDNGIKIALYHGPVANSKNSKGFEFSKTSITNFDGYDLVLLGDIHYHQYLNDEKTIAYASSLISQNFSETDINHGVLIWDLVTKNSYYKPIHNDYRYDEIEFINNTILYKKQKIKLQKLDLPINGKLKINSANCDLDIYNKFVFDIQDKYPNINIVHNKLLTNFNTITHKTNNYQPISIQSIIDDEINKLPEDTKVFVEKMLLKEIKLAIQSVDEKLNWKLLSLEFSNIFSYGPDNKIEFTSLTFDEITGLFGSNSIGKTSLIDILLFSLFDDYSRNYQDRNKILNGTIINTKEKTFSCKVSFIIDNTIYYIEKEGKRAAAKTDHTYDAFKFIKYDFYKIESNTKTSLNGVDRIETLNKIIKLIGNYDDFCVSSVCLQNNLRGKVDFFNMSPIEKRIFLNERLKFDIFKTIENKYKDLLKESKINLRNLEKDDAYINYDHHIDDKIIDITEKINNYESNKTLFEHQLLDYNTELNDLYKQLKPIDDSIDYDIVDKDDIFNSIQLYQTKLNKINNNNIDDDIDTLYNTNVKLSSKIKSSEYTFDNIIEKKELLSNISSAKKLINDLTLIKNKDNIISNYLIFEKQKLDKIISLKSKINNDYKLVHNNIITQNIIDSLNQIYDITHINDYSSQINEYKINILNIESKITDVYNSIKYTENILTNYNHVIVDPNIQNIYNNIDYNQYYTDTTNKLIDYDIYHELYKIIDTNNDIFLLLSQFNNSINHSCDNCINHSTNIKSLFNKLHINDDCNKIKKHFIHLQNIKNEYEQIIVYHYTNKLNNYKTTLDIFNSILDSEKNKLTQIINKSNNTVITDFKNLLQKHIYNIQQHNLNIELDNVSNSSYDKYIQLNLQTEQYNKLIQQINSWEKILVDIDNYDNDKNILSQIENNKTKINELKHIKYKINKYYQRITDFTNIYESINNYLFNTQIYNKIKSVKHKIDSITQTIIISNNEYINNTHLLELFNNNKIKYNTIILNINKNNQLIDIYQNIIKLSGPKGIPRQIINIKLQYVEDDVNNIIKPFINKFIRITKDIEDIKVTINDGISKYYSTGGMETFIISMAFKIAFTNTFNISHPGILFIDEGVSVLDKQHVAQFHIIADFMKKYYNHIILITHIDAFYDYTFDSINITKNKQKQSFVYYTK